MRLKAVLVAVLFVAVTASFAAAAPPPGKGNPGLALGTPPPVASSFGAERRRPPERRARTMVVIQGAFASGSVNASGVGSFVLMVERASKHERNLRGRRVTVHVDGRTRFGRFGAAALADLEVDDRIVTHARAARNAEGALRLLARRVLVRPTGSKELQVLGGLENARNMRSLSARAIL